MVLYVLELGNGECLTITIFNRYLNDSKYYDDSDSKTWIQILNIFHLWQRN